jgi:hypothetical protein
MQPGVTIAYKRIDTIARRTAFIVVKERARDFRDKPWKLGILHELLPTLSARGRIIFLKGMIRDHMTWGGLCLGGDIPRLNLQAALVHARYCRRFPIRANEGAP